MIVLGVNRAAGIPSAAAAAVSQMSSTVARLGGRLYVPYSPGIGPSVFVNSDGTGGVPGVGGIVGLLLDSSNGWGSAGSRGTNLDFSAGTGGWTLTGGVSFTVTGGVATISQVGASGGVFQDITVPPNSVSIVRLNARKVAGGAGAAFLWVVPRGDFAGPNQTAEITGAGFQDYVITNFADATTLRIYLQTVTSGAVIEVDGVSISSSPSSVATALTQSTGANKPLLASGAVPWAGALSFDGTDSMAGTINTGSGGYLAFAGRLQIPDVVVRCAIGTGGNAGTQPGGVLRMVTPTGMQGVVGNTSNTQDVVNLPIVSGADTVADFNWSGTALLGSSNGTEVTGTTVGVGASSSGTVVGANITSSGNYLAAGSILYATVVCPVGTTAADRAVIRRGLSAIAGLPI
jgi:hypothetical protein